MAFFKSISATNEAVTIITSWALSAENENWEKDENTSDRNKMWSNHQCKDEKKWKIAIKEELRKTYKLIEIDVFWKMNLVWFKVSV